MEPYASVEDLTARLDWDLSERELAMAAAALEDASVLVAIELGSRAATPPPLARTITLAAARRYISNPDGLTQTRAGDESLSFSEGGGTVSLTASEIGLLRRIVSPSKSFGTIPMNAWGSKVLPPETVYIPIDGENQRPIPHAGSWDWP